MKILSIGKDTLHYTEKWFNSIFGSHWNPFYYLGALTIFFFWVVLVSGIYVFILFETSIFGAFDSVEYITHEQWYLGGVMRSLHRYASDAAVVTLVIHLLGEFVKGRFAGVRWYSWLSGILLIWFVFPLGITGYWLVWDRLAQYIAVASSELLDWLPIFIEPMVRNFILEENISDRFFTLMAFIHVLGLPIFLIFGIWFHVLRISRPIVNPPRGLAIGMMAMLLVLSFVKPAISQGKTDLSQEIGEVGLDWFYLPVYPLIDSWSMGAVWALMLVPTVIMCLLPFIVPFRKTAAATVNLDNCNGCTRCFNDCPYGAIVMEPRSDGLKFSEEAVVDPSLCTSCGICVGACPTATPYRRQSDLIPGVDLPDFPVRDLRETLLKVSSELKGNDRVLVFGCDHGPELDKLKSDGVGVIKLPCISMLPPSFIDYILSRHHAEGVFMTGCSADSCFHRFGVQWMEERLAGKRDPYLRKRVPLERIEKCWGEKISLKELNQRIGNFRSALQVMPPMASGLRKELQSSSEEVTGVE